MLKHLMCAMVALTAGPAAAEDWTPFRDCLSSYGAAVDLAEPSLFDGARLIVDVLCLGESTALANQMVSSPARQAETLQRNFAEAFETYRNVIRREATGDLFEIRARRQRQE